MHSVCIPKSGDRPEDIQTPQEGQVGPYRICRDDSSVMLQEKAKSFDGRRPLAVIQEGEAIQIPDSDDADE